MALTSKITLSANLDHTSALDLGEASLPLRIRKTLELANGTGANQADRIFSDQRTLAASASEDLDLAGVLTDAFGAAITFARIKGLIISAASANTNNLVVGGHATAAFASWVGAAAHTLTVRPGGLLALTAPDATAYAVTAGTADILKIANSGAGSSVTYDIVVIGASA